MLFLINYWPSLFKPSLLHIYWNQCSEWSVRTGTKVIRQQSKVSMNAVENWRGNANGTIQRNWQHMIHKTKKSKTNTQHNMCWTPLWATTYTVNVNKTWAIAKTTGSKGEQTSFICGNRITYDLHYCWSDSEIVVILLIILLFKRSVVFLHFTYVYIVRILRISIQWIEQFKKKYHSVVTVLKSNIT